MGTLHYLHLELPGALAGEAAVNIPTAELSELARVAQTTPPGAPPRRIGKLTFRRDKRGQLWVWTSTSKAVPGTAVGVV